MIIELPPNQPVGVRFHPTDQELIYHYLQPKILGRHFDDAIAEIDICSWDPWELPHKSKIKSKPEDRMWWFMCQLSYKHRSSDRLNRKTKSGFWKPTGKPRTIKDNHDKGCIGKKRTLVFHTGKSPGKRTNWVMQEYYLDPKNMPSQERASYVICRLKKKTDEKVDTPDGDGREPIVDILPDHENSRPTATIQQLHDQTEVNHESGWPYDASHLPGNVISNFVRKELNGGDGLQMVSDESEEESFDDFMNGLLVDPNVYDNEMTSSADMSLKRPYFNGVSDGIDAGFEAMYAQALQSSSQFDSSGSSRRLRDCVKSQDFGQENAVSLSNPLIEGAPCRSIMSIMFIESSSDSISPRLRVACPPAHPRLYVRGIRHKRIQLKKDSPSARASSNKTLQSSSPYYSSGRSRRGIRQKRIQLHKGSPSAKTSSNKRKEALEHVVTTTDQPRTGTKIEEFRNVGKVAERSNVEKHNLDSDKCEASSNKLNTIFTLVETSSISTCNSQPRSVYWFNAITGTVLFGIFVKELVVFGSW